MNKKILIIDDEPYILEALKIMLEDEGYEVETALGTNDVLNHKKRLPDLILLDVILSGEDGREICKKIKQRNKSIPVFLMSAHPNIADSSSKYKADEFIAKPFDLDDTLRKIASYLK